MTSSNALDELRQMSVIVADTGDWEAVRRLKPVDCTTNPTLLLKAAQNPAQRDYLMQALRVVDPAHVSSDRVKMACEAFAVAVGTDLATIVPGRVSTEVDADLSFDTAATVAQAERIIQAYETAGVGREKILIKIAATWEGIAAARLLQQRSIDCNLTLLFSMEQAIAAAQAKAFLISPFVGRILDWHVKAGEGPFTPETDPGVQSVRRIYDFYKRTDIKTIVMGASFRSVEQVLALAGCDRLTISPALLDELATRNEPVVRQLDPAKPLDKNSEPGQISLDEANFRIRLNENAMASEKLAEGIRLFARDLRALRELIAHHLEIST